MNAYPLPVDIVEIRLDFGALDARRCFIVVSVVSSSIGSIMARYVEVLLSWR